MCNIDININIVNIGQFIDCRYVSESYCLICKIILNVANICTRINIADICRCINIADICRRIYYWYVLSKYIKHPYAQGKFLTQLEYVTMIKRGHATSQSHDIQENISLTDSEVKMPKMYNIMVRNCIK